MLHQKADGVTATATTKTFIDLFGGGNGKTGRFFIMEGAEPEVIDTPFLQFHKTANDIDDVDTALDLLYGLLCDQGNARYEDTGIRGCGIQDTGYRRQDTRYRM
jgi:hypothetical protein